MPTQTSDDAEVKVSKRDVDAGFAWIIVVVVMLNFFNLNTIFAGFSVLYQEYVETFDMTVGQIGIAMSVYSCSATLAGMLCKFDISVGVHVEFMNPYVSCIGYMSLSRCFLHNDVLGMVIPGVFSHLDQRIICVAAALVSSMAFMASGLIGSYTGLLITYSVTGEYISF